MPAPVYISGAVEGRSDGLALRRLVATCGGKVHAVYGQDGKANLRKRISGFNAAARQRPWLVLVDLDRDYPCAGALVSDWLPEPSALMRLRVVVRQLESWVLADHQRFAEWFRVRESTIPVEPDGLDDAREALLHLVAGSRKRALREDMLPREGSGRKIGPAYTSRIEEFLSDSERGWRPRVAARRSPSLASCLARLSELVNG